MLTTPVRQTSCDSLRFLLLVCRSLRLGVLRASAAILLSLAAIVTIRAQSPNTGTVAGRVFNAGTRAYLGNVEVRDRETGRTAITTPEGSFGLNLPSGSRTLIVSYGGLDPQEITVAVTAGGTVTREIGLSSADYDKDIIRMEGFIVASEKEGRAASIAQQKQAENIVSVISSDEFTNVAGGNIGDFLRNVPGISIEYSGADPRSISVRGMDPNMTAVTVNGTRAANASSGSTNRTFELDQTSLQDVESIEIFKSPPASMEADSGGGTINMVSKSAFKLKGRRISYSLLANANSTDFTFRKTVLPDDSGMLKIRPGGTFAYSEAFLGNRLGVAFTANYNEFYLNARQFNNNFGLTSGVSAFAGTPAESATGLHSRGFTYAISPNMTQRTSVSLNLDFRLSDHTTLWSRNQISTSLITGGGRSLDVGVNAPTNPAAATNGVAAGWTVNSLTALGDGTTTVAQAATSTSSTFAHVAGEYLDKPGIGTQFALGSTTKLGAWKIDTAISTSLSTNHYRNHGSMPVPQVDLYLRGISYRIDQPYGAEYPALTQLSGPSIYDLGNYVSRAATGATSNVTGTNLRVLGPGGSPVVYPATSTGTGASALTYPQVIVDNPQNAPFQLRNGRRGGGKDVFNTAKFDVRRDFTTRFLTYAQTGALFRRQDRSIDRVGQTRWLYVGPDGIAGTADDALLNLGQFKSTNLAVPVGPYPMMPYYNLEAINAFFTSNRQLFKEDTAFLAETEGANARSITEKVTAGYAMAGGKVGRLNVLVGLRYELTQGTGEGPIADNEAARDAAIADLLGYVKSQGYATVNDAPAAVRGAFRADATKISRVRYARQATAAQRYDNLFPNVQLRYAVTRDFLVRTSFTESIARQNFANIMPGYTATAPASGSDGRSTVTINNTKLKPVYFQNFDVSLEYYLKGGLVAVSFFHKDVSNYTVDSTEIVQPGVDYGYDLSGYVGDTLIRKTNAGSARQKGVEFSYSQQLGTLSDVLRDVSMFASYTYQQGESNATYGGASAVPTSLPIGRLVPRMANAGLRYRHRKTNASVTYNWKSDYFTGTIASGNGINALRYWYARGMLDVSASYDFYQRHAVFIEVKNVTNEPARDYIVNRGLLRTYNTYGAMIYFGLKGAF